MESGPQEEDDGYCTFIALNRPAMLWGFPVKVLIVGFPVLLLSGFLFPLLFGFWGCIVPVCIAALMLTIKGYCEMDPRKPEKILLRTRAFMRRLGRSKGGLYMLQGTPHSKYDRNRVTEHFSRH